MAFNDTSLLQRELAFDLSKLYLLSGQFSSSLKTSLPIGLTVDHPNGEAWDGVNTILGGEHGGGTGTILFIFSGQFSATIKDSEDVSSIGFANNVSADLTNIPWIDVGSLKLFLQSGKVTSTLKTSQDISSQARSSTDDGISFDGTNTPWLASRIATFDAHLFLTSGQFSSTIKDSEDISGIESRGTGITFDGTNTPWAGQIGDATLYLTSGQFTSTIKTSIELTFGFGTPAGLDTNAVSLSISTSGTIIVAPATTEADMVAGGEILILALNTGRLPPTSDTWHADIGSDNARTDALLAGIVSSGIEPNGWNNVITPLLTFAQVTRVSDVTVTIDFPAAPGYDISISELVAINVPTLALTGGNGPIEALRPIVIEPVIITTTDDTPWAGSTDQKLYLQSNTFTSTIKTSEAVGGAAGSSFGIAFDGTNTPRMTSSERDIILQSGQFTATVKVSFPYSPSFAALGGISSTESLDTPVVKTASPAKLFNLSGQFTGTLKDSESVGGFISVGGISWDGTNTPWVGNSGFAGKLFLQSGQFTSTLKTSEDVSAIGLPRDITFRGSDTPWMETSGTSINKLMLQSGQFTSTLKTSEDVVGVDTRGQGIDHNARFSSEVALNVVPSDADITEQEIRDGAITILLGLIAETWVATVGDDNSITQALIDGMLSDLNESRGWNNVVRDGLTAANVLRVSDTVVIVTLPAFSNYEITVTETITVTAPAVALTDGTPLIGTPSYSVSADPTPPAPRRTVRAKYKNSEWESYISPDGVEYPFHTPHNLGRWIVSQTGWGTPPIEYITQRGPFQHGVTVKDFFLQPRVIQLLIRQAFCDRDEWWDGRAALLNEIRPNRQTISTAVVPGRLQRCLPDGTLRAIEVFISDGPRFEQRQVNTWDEWAFQEVLRFVAHDPVIFDPTRNDVNFTIVLDGELVFPITFPIEFGPGEVDDTLNINYVGTWESLPIIVITGPIEQPRIDNLTTGEKLEFSIDIDPGQVVTVDLSYGSKTVLDQDGNNLIGGLTADSDLATFHIAPDPEAPLGVNQMRLQGMHATGATDIEIRYFDRYFGI